MKIQPSFCLGRMAGGLLLAGSLAWSMLGICGETTRVSINSNGVEGNLGASSSSISMDGRYVAFWSRSTNLVAGDTNGERDVFVHDRQTGETTRVSVDSNGVEGKYGGYNPTISANGRYVAFQSYSSNLVEGDNNDAEDIFVHDRQTGETTRISVNSNTADGNGGSYFPSISADGRYVAFQSYASNLVEGDNNDAEDIFVHDRQTGETTLASVANNGNPAGAPSESPSISSDGRYVAFSSYASLVEGNLLNSNLNIFVHDRQMGETSLVSVESHGADESFYDPSISADGRYIVFSSNVHTAAGWANRSGSNIFVYGRQTGTTEQVSVNSQGTGGNHNSTRSSISPDGRYVVFESFSTQLVEGDTNGFTDVFIHDRQTRGTMRLSVDSSGVEGNDYSGDSLSISGDGRYVAFGSGATNLVPGDANASYDIFVHDREGDTSTPPTAHLTLHATLNGQATIWPGPAFPDAGSPLTWSYTVSNDGGSAAEGVRLFSKALKPQTEDRWTLLCFIGAISADDSQQCESHGLVEEGRHKTLLSAQGVDSLGNKISFSLPAYYGGSDTAIPSLDLAVVTNGMDNDNISPGPSLTTGETVTFTYTVTNSGPAALQKIRVFDHTESPRNNRWRRNPWNRVCEIAALSPGETTTCNREAVVEAGIVQRRASAVSFHLSKRIQTGESSYYTGQQP